QRRRARRRQQQAPQRRRRRGLIIPSLSTSPLPGEDGSSIHSSSATVTESSTPKLSAEELQAWEMLEQAQNNEEEAATSISLPTSMVESSSTTTESPKFKRPTRRRNHGTTSDA